MAVKRAIQKILFCLVCKILEVEKYFFNSFLFLGDSQCRDKRPKSICWVVGLIRGHLMVRGHIDNRKRCKSQSATSKLQLRGLWKIVEGGRPPRLSGAQGKRFDLLGKATPQKVLLLRTNCRKACEREAKEISGEKLLPPH